MRILVATGQWFPETTGGSARVATETAFGLAHRGHEVTVVAPRSAEPAVEELAERLRIHRSLPRSVLPVTLTDVVWTARSVRKLSGFDVALAHQSTCAAGLVAAGFPSPVALVFHASALRELRFLRSRLPPVKRLPTYGLDPVLARFERLAVTHAASILVLSEFSKALIEADHPGAAARVARVAGGVDVDRFAPGDGTAAARARLGVPAGARLLVTARRLEPRMGIEQLVEAVRMLRDSQDVKLVVLGSGSLAGVLHERVNELGLRDAVELRGRVSDEDLVDWYRAADLFVLPTAAYEGFGMVTVEALATGTPVVGTAIGATPELLEPLDRRLVAPTPDAHALASTIEAALPLVNPALRAACRRYATDTFAWPHVLEGWERALERAASSEQTAHAATAVTRA